MGYGCAEGAARIAKLLYNRSGSAQACCRHEALCLDASGLNTQRVPVALPTTQRVPGAARPQTPAINACARINALALASGMPRSRSLPPAHLCQI